MGVTDARTIRALYCNELEMSAGQNERAAMQWSRNHFGQLGRLAVCAMGRSDSAWMHGGEHGSGRFGGCGGLLVLGEQLKHGNLTLGVRVQLVDESAGGLLAPLGNGGLSHVEVLGHRLGASRFLRKPFVKSHARIVLAS